MDLVSRFLPIPLVLFVGNLGDDGVMVAGCVAAVGLDPDLGGAVVGLVGVYATLVGCPVAIGENAVVVGCRTADIIIGPIGIAIADAMLGEVTARMAEAVGQSNAERILIPFQHCGSLIVGVNETNTGKLVAEAIGLLCRLVQEP